MALYVYLHPMNPEFEIIPFQLLGLSLQEPMALISNWSIASFAFFAFFQLKNMEGDFHRIWRLFFLLFGLSTFFGGLGHAFFQYTGIYGKMPSWTFGVLSGYAAARAMFTYFENPKLKTMAEKVVLLESALVLVLAIAFQSFLFVAVDAILTYLFACGVLAVNFYRRGIQGMQWIAMGVIILLPSAFIFLLKINVHRLLNRDDLSHWLMLTCIVFFYMGIRAIPTKRQIV